MICIFSFIIFTSIDLINVKADDVIDKVYCEATIEDDFSDSSVCIILTRDESLKFKEYTIADFITDTISEIGISSIVELTESMTNIIDTDENYDSLNCSINTENFRRIFLLNLVNKGKNNVLTIINELEDDIRFRYVGVDYKHVYEPMSSDSALTSGQLNNYLHCNLSNTWSITMGSSNIRVGVLDTGIYSNHPDLIDNVDTTLSKDFTGENQHQAYGDHGTIVAGIIAANGEIKGVAPNITLVSLRVFSSSGNDFTTMSSRLIQAISYASEIGIKVLNFSGGRSATQAGPCEAERQAISNFDGLFVEAAGNDGIDVDAEGTTKYYPVCYNCENMIVVGGLGDNGSEKASDYDWYQAASNFGKVSVDLFAPGTVTDYTSISNNSISMEGTSFAAPFVSGTAALLYSLYPDMSPSEIKNLILNNITIEEKLTNYCVTGGKLNIYDTLTAHPLIGDGTATNPYLIASKGSFNLIDDYDNSSVYFKQVANINFKNGTHDLHNYVFKGNYDGNYSYLMNIESDQTLPTNQVFGAMFGTNQGVIKKVKLSGIDINISTQTITNGCVGGLVGSNQSIIENIVIYNSSIIANGQNINVGGIAGESCKTSGGYSIFQCTLENSDVYGNGYVGGILGVNETGHIYSCYITGSDVSYEQNSLSNKGAGGIIGLNKDKVSMSHIDSYSYVKYSGAAITLLIKPRLGLIVGINWSGEDNIINCLAIGNLDAGNLNSSLNQTDYIGAFYNGKVGLEEI